MKTVEKIIVGINYKNELEILRIRPSTRGLEGKYVRQEDVKILCYECFELGKNNGFKQNFEELMNKRIFEVENEK